MTGKAEARRAAVVDNTNMDDTENMNSSDDIGDNTGDKIAEQDPRSDVLSERKARALALAAADPLRMVEALLFAAAEPLDEASLAARLPEGADVPALIAELQELYSDRGVNLVRVAEKWIFRTAGDLSFIMQREAVSQRRLSRAALETLAIVAYHQPVTRAEIEEIRGVTVSKGTLDVLMETGWVRLRGRKRAPGRPVTYGTSDAFMTHFGLENLKDLPGLEELKASGLLDSRLPPDFNIPSPTEASEEEDDSLLMDDDDMEDFLDDDETDERE